MKRCNHLTGFHRRTMGQLLKQGVSKRKIAINLAVHPTTIFREFRRNRSSAWFGCEIGRPVL
ncbi:MAG: helix-turn-helix domain-containing protein [Prosthecobacter sp.]|nr:helix-turn-helix domain-containing protein [Prosthecobacter sp.]